jgi:hypothetical protein
MSMKEHSNNLPQWILITCLTFTLSILEATEPRAPRPVESYGIETQVVPSDEGTAVCCALPRDIHIEGDLTIDGNEIIEGNLTIDGTLTLLGPIVFPPLFHADLLLQPINPTPDICIVWLDNAIDGGTEKARICDSNIVNEKGLFISIDSGVTKNFQVDNASNTDIAGNLDLVTSTALAGNITKAGTPFIHNYGTDNTFVGINAGNFTLIGSSNAGLGDSSLLALTNGAENTALGDNAGINITTGNSNTISGKDAAFSLTTGGRNIFIGRGASFSTNSNNCIVLQCTTGGGTQLTADNQIRIGFGDTASTSCFIDGINSQSTGATANVVGINSSGQLGTSSTTFTLSGNEHVTGTSRLDGNVGIGQASGPNKLNVTGDFVLIGNQETTGYSQINTSGSLGLYNDGTQVTSPAGYNTGAYFDTTRTIHAHINGSGTILYQSGGLACTKNGGSGSYELFYDPFVAPPTIVVATYSSINTVAIVDSSFAITATESRIRIQTIVAGIAIDDEFMVVIMGQAV